LALPFTVSRDHPCVVTVRMDWKTRQEQWFLLRSDAHHDNRHCDQSLERKHLEQAKERGAGILDVGDLFCAMQGKWDKRSDVTQARPELQVSNYLDALVNYCADFYEPYAPNWVLLAPGNHEGSIHDRHQTNLTERLAERLKAKGSPVQVGTYQGWVRFLFTVYKAQRSSVKLRYTHGYGGGGQVTRDIIQANRQMVYIGNADILVSGHTHDAWEVPVRREVLLDSGRPELRDVDCVKCGGYKDEFSPGQGWAVGKGHNPKPLGARWLRFYTEGSKVRTAVKYELLRAK
jgi:hypothetical protein